MLENSASSTVFCSLGCEMSVAFFIHLLRDSSAFLLMVTIAYSSKSTGMTGLFMAQKNIFESACDLKVDPLS